MKLLPGPADDGQSFLSIRIPRPPRSSPIRIARALVAILQNPRRQMNRVIRFSVMRIAPAFFGLLLAAFLPAQKPEQPAPKGVVYGTVFDPNGQPAKHLLMAAEPFGVGLGSMLPTTETDDNGNYRFENLSEWGRWTVFAVDEKQGYSYYTEGHSLSGPAPQATLSPQHPEAKFDVHLPPKAGFLYIHLTNQKTGELIKAIEGKVASQEDPSHPILTMGYLSGRALLVPPDKDLLIHVTSPGFLEWNQSLGIGYPIHIASGASLQLDISLQPADP